MEILVNWTTVHSMIVNLIGIRRSHAATISKETSSFLIWDDSAVNLNNPITGHPVPTRLFADAQATGTQINSGNGACRTKKSSRGVGAKESE